MFNKSKKELSLITSLAKQQKHQTEQIPIVMTNNPVSHLKINELQKIKNGCVLY